jgi:hypothetical protein
VSRVTSPPILGFGRATEAFEANLLDSAEVGGRIRKEGDQLKK